MEGILFTIYLYSFVLWTLSHNFIDFRLGSVSLLARNSGTLAGYILGACLEYDQIPYVCVFLPVIYLVVFAFLPNTPRYYLYKGENYVRNK